MTFNRVEIFYQSFPYKDSRVICQFALQLMSMFQDRSIDFIFGDVQARTHVDSSSDRTLGHQCNSVKNATRAHTSVNANHRGQLFLVTSDWNLHDDRV